MFNIVNIQINTKTHKFNTQNCFCCWSDLPTCMILGLLLEANDPLLDEEWDWLNVGYCDYCHLRNHKCFNPKYWIKCKWSVIICVNIL